MRNITNIQKQDFENLIDVLHPKSAMKKNFRKSLLSVGLSAIGFFFLMLFVAQIGLFWSFVTALIAPGVGVIMWFLTVNIVKRKIRPKTASGGVFYNVTSFTEAGIEHIYSNPQLREFFNWREVISFFIVGNYTLIEVPFRDKDGWAPKGTGFYIPVFDGGFTKGSPEELHALLNSMTGKSVSPAPYASGAGPHQAPPPAPPGQGPQPRPPVQYQTGAQYPPVIPEYRQTDNPAPPPGQGPPQYIPPQNMRGGNGNFREVQAGTPYVPPPPSGFTAPPPPPVQAAKKKSVTEQPPGQGQYTYAEPAVVSGYADAAVPVPKKRPKKRLIIILTACALIVVLGAGALIWALAGGSKPKLLYEIYGDGYRIVSAGEDFWEEELEIPSKYKGLPVVKIEAAAFRQRDSITSVTIPASVKEIGDNAFADCYSLKSVTFAAGADPSLGASVFSGCYALETVTLGSGITKVGNRMFFGCSMLKSVTLPDSIKTIGGYAFSSCSQLTGVIIPASVQELGEFAFYGTRITEITIPSGVSVLKKSLFEDCGQLKKVYFSSSVTKIEATAFKNTHSLTDIYFNGTETQLRAIDYDWMDIGDDVWVYWNE